MAVDGGGVVLGQDAASGSARATGSGRAAGTVRAWDLPTRLFKWSLVALVVTAWITRQGGDDWMRWHILNGYALLILVTFRLIWGFVGPSTARFSAWVTWPWRALAYGVELARGRAPRYLSHNPLGGWMIIILLAFVGTQAISGLFTVDHNGLAGGPFANLDFGDPTPVQRLLARYHHVAFYVLLVFVAAHIVVNLTYQFAKGDPVVAAMITGEKPAYAFIDQPEMRSPPGTWWRALLSLAAATAVVLGSVKLFGGTLP